MAAIEDHLKAYALTVSNKFEIFHDPRWVNLNLELRKLNIIRIATVYNIISWYDEILWKFS